ncbi:MAG: ABC transporter permease subunit [Rhodobacterales bacterium]|nr:ABC transporter permease subunit [Rhodobacterales bacterium]
MSTPDYGESPWRAAWIRFRRDPVAVGFLALFMAYFGVAVLAQLVELWDGAPFLYELNLSDMGMDVPETATAPELSHPLRWLGTTSAGKSVILRVFHGTKVAFVVGSCGAGLSVIIGLTLGLVGGWFGRTIDEIIVYIYSTVASVPYLLLMLALAFVVRQGPIAAYYRSFAFSEFVSLGLFNIVVVIGLTSWVTLCRLIRAEVKKVRELEYVHAARALGLSDTRILFKHVLPNVFHLVIINFSLTFVTAIKSEVILTFLGVGVDREPSWGQMISDARSELMQGVWWPLAASGIALFVLTLSVNYVGDALRDALDPRLK